VTHSHWYVIRDCYLAHLLLPRWLWTDVRWSVTPWYGTERRHGRQWVGPATTDHLNGLYLWNIDPGTSRYSLSDWFEALATDLAVWAATHVPILTADIPPTSCMSHEPSLTAVTVKAATRKCPIHTADATQHASAVWIQFATSLRRLPTDSVDNLESGQTDSVAVWPHEFLSILILFSTMAT